MSFDLISRSALKKDLLDRSFFPVIVKAALEKAPTVDAVEVVRCKDCKFAYINSFSAAAGVAVCRKLSTEAGTAIRNHDDFCSYGERRADDGKL